MTDPRTTFSRPSAVGRSLRRIAAALAMVAAAAVLVPAAPAAAVSGGAAARPGQFPWLAAVLSASASATHPDAKCSGVVVAPRWVMTAGHCAAPGTTGLSVVTGRVTLSASGASRTPVDRVVRMPGYSYRGDSPVNDVSLLHLATPTRAPAALLLTTAEARTIRVGTETLAAGWGLSDPDWVKQDTLRWARLDLLSPWLCRSRYGARFVTSDHLCAGWDWPRMTHDTCNGDSGGPLLMRTSRGWVVVATTSWGDACGTRNVPGVYMKTSDARCWVASVTGVAQTGCGTTRRRTP